MRRRAAPVSDGQRHLQTDNIIDTHSSTHLLIYSSTHHLSKGITDPSRTAPHHARDRRRAAQRGFLYARAGPATRQEDGQLRRSRQLPPVLWRPDRAARHGHHLLRVARRATWLTGH